MTPAEPVDIAAIADIDGQRALLLRLISPILISPSTHRPK